MTHYEIQNIERYLYHDSICNKLLDVLVKRRIEIDDFDYYFSFHNERREELARDALVKCFIHHL